MAQGQKMKGTWWRAVALMVQHQLIVKDPEPCIQETKGVLAHVRQFSHLSIPASS